MASDGRRRRAGNRSGEAAQLVLFKKRGGKRRGAGRPPKGKRAGERHKARPFLHARYPVHVVLRAVAAVGNLRRRRVYQAIREATLTTARREDFRIVHLSLQRTGRPPRCIFFAQPGGRRRLCAFVLPTAHRARLTNGTFFAS